MTRDARRTAQMLTIRTAIDVDPLEAHRRLGNVILTVAGVSFLLGVLVGWVL